MDKSERMIDIVINNEGGYSFDSEDPGGETMYGITKSVAVQFGYTGKMIALPIELARKIYKLKYYDVIKVDKINDFNIGLNLLDFAVHSGPSLATRYMQSILGVKIDGVMGPVTIFEINKRDPFFLSIKYIQSRAEFLIGLPIFKKYGRGWIPRIIGNLKEK